MRFPVFSLLVVLCACTVAVSGKKILFITPNLSNSMVLYTGRMADVLVNAGHNVTFFIPQITPSNVNGTKLARVVLMEDLGTDFLEHMQKYSGDLLNPRPSIFSRRSEMTALRKVCEKILTRKSEIDWMRREKFDMAIASNLDFCDLGLIRMFNIPLHIWTTTGRIHDITALTIGIPPETSYVPTIWDNFMGPVMNVRERLVNFVRIYTDRLLTYENNYHVTRLFRKYVRPNFPEVAQIASDSALLFVNGNEFLDPVRPLPSKVIQIGGIGLKTPPTLRGQFAEMAQKGEKGFILFSLGSAAPTMAIPGQTKKEILQAFAHFPDYHFIVKADQYDEVFRNLSFQTSNVDVVSWVPQPSLLAHPDCKVFITHAGYNSILESGLSGVPMLTIPLFFDQHHNAKAVEYKEIGRVLLPQHLEMTALRREIQILLNDPTYDFKAKRIARLARDNPNQPDETLVKWVNFVLANGPLPELKPELLNLSFVSYNNLDIFGLLFAALFVSFQFVRYLLFVFFNSRRRDLVEKTKMC